MLTRPLHSSSRFLHRVNTTNKPVSASRLRRSLFIYYFTLRAAGLTVEEERVVVIGRNWRNCVKNILFAWNICYKKKGSNFAVCWSDREMGTLSSVDGPERLGQLIMINYDHD